MLFIVGIVGFIGGFIVGQAILFIILRNRSNDELLASRQLHWTYGTLNWLIAMLTMAGSMAFYRYIVDH